MAASSAGSSSRSGGGTRLTLWHNINRGFISMGAAGWHICFDVLDRLLAGQPIGRIVGAEAMQFGGWQRLNAEYAKQFGVETPRCRPSRNEELDMSRSTKRIGHRLLDRHRALLLADRLHRVRAAAPAAGCGGVHPPRLPRLLPGGALVGQARRDPGCCSRRCRRGSRSGHTPASPSTSALRSSLTSRWAMARRRGAGRQGTGVLWALSYFFWRRLQTGTAESADHAPSVGLPLLSGGR